MSSNGFLVLIEQILLQKFSQDQTLKAKNWLIVNLGDKIVVHGPNRDPLGDPDILTEITSYTYSKLVCIERKAKGTIPDQGLLIKLIKDLAPYAEIITTPPTPQTPKE